MKSVLRLGDVPVRPSEEGLSMKPFRIQSDTAFARSSRALHPLPLPQPQQPQEETPTPQQSQQQQAQPQHLLPQQPQQQQQLQRPPRSQTQHHSHRPQPPSACPYCQAAEAQRDEYLELESAMPRQRPRGWPSAYACRIATSTAGPSGRSSDARQSLGPMQLKWKAALSNIFKGRRGLDREAIRREEAVSWLVSSGVFREPDAENLRQHFFKLPSCYATSGFTAEQVKEHMELLEGAAKLKDSYVAMRIEVKVDGDCTSAQLADVSTSDSSSASSAGGFSSLSSDGFPQVCKVEVTFASGAAHVCRPELACALRQAGFSVLSLTVYDVTPHGSLGMFAAKVYRDDLSQEILENVFSSVLVQRTPSNRWLPMPHLLAASRNSSDFGRESLLAKAESVFSRDTFFSDRKCDSECLSLRGTGSRRGESPCRSMGHRRLKSTTSAGDVEGMLQFLGSDKSTRDISKFILDPLKLELGPVLASGASGEVRLGRYEGKEVAVKILKSTVRGKDSEALVAEFRREVVTLMACGECPHLLKFYGIFVDARSRMFIVTKFMKGGTLHEYLQKRNGRKLPLRELVRIATDIAGGMEFLHRNGITHRDLKSANVLLEEDGHAVVGDFGVAKLKGERGEMTKEVGTYRWMAPEAFGTSAWPVTHKSDVYSFGIVLWELASLSLPFESYTPVQAAVAVTLNGVRPAIPEDCPPQLRTLMQKCWAKSPEDRPDFSQVLQDLQRMWDALGPESEGQPGPGPARLGQC